MFDPIIIWSVVAVVSGSLAWIVAASTHHARLARFGALVGISVTLVVAYLGLGEPRVVRWGATPAEASGSSWRLTTRAVSIDAPAERVWRLLLLDRSTSACVSSQVVPGRALVQQCRSGTRAFVVEPRSKVTSRVIARTMTATRSSLMARTVDRVVAGPVRFVHERRLLHHLRQRAEGRPVYVADDMADSTPWLFALLLAIVSAVGALAARRGWGWVGAFASSALAVVVLPLAQPPAVLGLLWTLGTLSAIAGLVLRGPPEHQPRF